MSKYIFATDIDGTFLGDNGKPNKFTVEKFKEASEKGHISVLATGRSKRNIQEIAHLMHGVKFFVANNGSLVHDVETGKDIFLKSLKTDILNDIYIYAKENNLAFALHTNKNVYRFPKNQEIGDEMNDDFMCSQNVFYSKTKNQDILWNGEKITQIALHGKEEIIQKNYEDIYQKLNKLYSVYLTNGVFIDINPLRVSKWTGLLEISKYKNIQPDHIVTFGDSGNDFEMLYHAKSNGYALKNSKKDLRKKIKIHEWIGDNNSDTIGAIIDKYLKKETN